MLGIMDIIWATMERGAPRLSQLPRLMPKLPQRLTPGCIITVLAMLLILMDTDIMVWATLPMPDITPTLTTEQA